MKQEYKETRIPVKLNDNGNWTKVKLVDTVYVDLPEEEATHTLVHAFWIEPR